MKRSFQLVFQSNDPDNGAVIRAIRFLLRRMLRSLGLKALSITETTPVDMTLATPPIKLHTDADGTQTTT